MQYAVRLTSGQHRPHYWFQWDDPFHCP